MRRFLVVSLWLLALLLTLVSAAWQRRSGPTYPVRDTASLLGEEIPYRLLRSETTGEPLPVRITVTNPAITGELWWRRYPSNHPWQQLPLVREGDELRAELPSLPPAGKLEYQVALRRGDTTVHFPAKPAVARFKGAVPSWVLAPHIAAMFLGMLFANAAALSALANRPQAVRQAWVTLGLLTIGGLLLGPIVQKYAFDAFWTGWPFGHDLTDNKTAVAVLAWALALWRTRGRRPARGAIVTAAVITLAVFLIPHSTWGSELAVEPVAGAAEGA
jgi:hypothetical protein